MAFALRTSHQRTPRGCRSGGENALIHIAIVGVGLIGGSLGLALRKNKKRFHITGLGRSKANLAIAKRRGAVDTASTNVSKVLGQSDIVILCIPVHQIVPFVLKNLKHFKPGALITDVGSVKGNVVAGMKLALSERRDLEFVGAHPIAGSEKTGVENAKADLFRGASCVITNDQTSFRALDTVRELWKSVGAKCFLMSAAAHDKTLALTSHLPHLLSFGLFAQVVAQSKKSPLIKSLVGGSFRDMTRIAGADADLWTGIISSNRGEINKAAEQFQNELRAFSKAAPARLHQILKDLARTKSAW